MTFKESEMKYSIGVHGCDDSSIFEMELTDEEADVVKRVAFACTETSTYGCMPTMNIEAVETPNA
jgi:hypothetical protein